jgi:predicted nucleotidyltransferase
MKVKHSGPAAPRLAEIRTRWLTSAIDALRADGSVTGAALVGSLGDGRADDWSDVDLLVVVEDGDLDEYAAAERLPSGPGRVGFAIDARHNGPRGTRALSAQYVVEGLPLWVDWHLHPRSQAQLPADGTVVFERSTVDRTALTFSEYLNRGDHEPAIPSAPDAHLALRLALIPVAAKQVVRRAPEAARTIEFLGAAYEPNAGRRDQLAALRHLLDELEGLGRRESLEAARAHLTLTEQTLSQ